MGWSARQGVPDCERISPNGFYFTDNVQARIDIKKGLPWEAWRRFNVVGFEANAVNGTAP